MVLQAEVFELASVWRERTMSLLCVGHTWEGGWRLPKVCTARGFPPSCSSNSESSFAGLSEARAFVLLTGSP